MKQISTLMRGGQRAGRVATWLLALLGLLLLAPGAVRGQVYRPIAVRATPAGPLSFCAGGSQVLTAQAVVPAFVTGTGFDGTVRVAVVQDDGKTVVGGDFLNYNGTPCAYLARLNLDGSLDTAFGIGSRLDGAVYAITVLSSGQIAIGGNFTKVDGVNCGRLARLLASGALDTNFTTSGTGRGFDGVVRAIAEQSTGSLVVGGDFQSYGSLANSKFLVRLGTTGVLDATFASNTHNGLNLFNSSVYALAVYTDDKLLVGGSFVVFFTGGRKGLARLLATGALDTSFASTGDGPTGGTIKTILLIDDGPMLVGGTFLSYDHNSTSTSSPALAYLDQLGVVRPASAFTSGFTSPAIVNSISFGPVDFLIGGSFTTYAGSSRNNVVSISDTGVLDTNFDVGVGFDSPVNSVARGTTGLCTIGGEFTIYKSNTAKRIARLLDTGAPHSSDIPVSGASYLWSTGATTPSITVSTSGTYSATSSSAYNTATSNAVSVTVNPRPVANAGPAVSTCSGNTTNPAILGTAAVAGNTYSWSPAAGLSSATVAQPVVTLTNTTSAPITQTYTLTVTSAAGCTNTSTVAVTVNPRPVANAGTAVTLCSGGSATLGTAAVAGNTYSWSPSTGLSSATVAQPTLTLTNTTSTATTQTYTLTVTNSATGCTNTSTVAATVNPLPVATAGAARSICVGTSTQLGAAAVAGYTYSWSPATGLSSPTVANPTVSPTTPGTTTYTLTVTGAAGCTNTSTVVVTVNPLPVANAGSNQVICQGGSAQLGGAPVAGYTYSWSPTTGLNSSTIANPIASPSASTTYILTVTAAGCPSVSTVTVTVNPLPVANAGTAVTFCSGGSATLGTAAVAGNTYSWSPSNGLSSTTAAQPTVTLTNTTAAATTQTYTLTVTSATNCTSTNTVAVTVNPLPVVATAAPAVAICAGGTAALGAAPVAGYTYSWSPATGLSSATAANPTVTLPNTTGAPLTATYTLTVTSGAGCTASSTVQVTVNPLPVISSITPTGPLGATITINGTGLQGATSVTFAGAAGGPAVSASVASVNATGTQLTVVVPPGAGDGPLTVTTPCGTTPPFGRFGVLRVLIVSTPNAPVIQGGTYNTIIVTGTGIGTLQTGNVFVTDSVAVLDGGILRLGPYQLEGPGYFRLASGGTLSMGYPGGLAPPGTVGAVDMTGNRRYSLDANYIYTGTANQVTGLGLPARVRNLTDSTKVGAALTLSAPTSVAQVLTIASATDFNLSGKVLTLLSDASGTALVVNSSGGKVVGATGTMQRYIDPTYNTGTGYRYYSPPVAGATVATLGTTATGGSFTPTVNATYNTAPNPLTVAPFPTVFRYQEARLGALLPGLSAFDNGLYSPAAPTEALAVGAGYAVSLPATEKINFVGTFTTGDQPPLTLTRSSPPASASGPGWNLVGNPYPAPLNWDLVAAADRPNLDAALYTYESTGPNAGIYFSYVNGVGGSPLVAAGKSFFVRVKQGQTAGTLTLRNSQRITSFATQAGFGRPQLFSGDMVEFELDYTGGKKNRRPPTSIYADVSALPLLRTTSVFNPNLDAYRIPATTGLNLSININAPTQADELAIKAIPPFTAGQEVPLTVRVPLAGSQRYELHAFTLQIPAGLTAFLDDRLLGISTNLSLQSSYSFTVAQANVAIANRFFLRFGSVTPTRTWAATSDVAVYPNPAHTQATVQIPGLPGATSVEVTLLNTLGQVVRQQRAALPTTGTSLSLAVQDLAAGVYVLRLRANDAVAVRRLVVE